MKKLLSAGLLLMLLQSFASAQSHSSAWPGLNALLGDWVASGSGKPGQGSGTFSFAYNLGDKIIIRKSRTDYPASGDKPAFTHEDLLIIYDSYSGLPPKAIYFDNEGHTINYTVSCSEDGKQIQFISDQFPNKSAYRLTYEFSDKNNMTINFEISQDGKAESFRSYVKGTAERKK